MKIIEIFLLIIIILFILWYIKTNFKSKKIENKTDLKYLKLEIQDIILKIIVNKNLKNKNLIIKNIGIINDCLEQNIEIPDKLYNEIKIKNKSKKYKNLNDNIKQLKYNCKIYNEKIKQNFKK